MSVPSGSDAREAVYQALEESAFYAARGARPPAQPIAPPKVGAVVARLAHAARQEMLTFDDPSGCLAQKVPERMLVHAASCVQRAVTAVPWVRQITSRQGLAQDRELGTIAWRNGGQARLIPQIPFRMAVMDRSVAMIPLDLDVFYNGMLLIRDPVMVRALVRIHDGWWATGDDPAANRSSCELPPHLASVLACLNAGLSDRAAAAQAGLSPRTYSRRVNELLTLLGTTSRFQAGALAIRRGWI
ncbi:hypothetical protein AB0G05_45160 [Nonomuraea wenchangensis]